MYETHLWIYWLSIAADHETASRAMREEATTRPLGGATTQLFDAELEHALVAVSSAAHTVDGFYGATAALIAVPAAERAAWARNRTPRPARIIETLKRGFDIGHYAAQWTADLRWLYRLRDSAVHPAVNEGSMVRHASGMSFPAVHPNFSAEAPRAVRVAVTVAQACLEAPRKNRPDLVAWCDTDKRRAVETALRPREVARPEAFKSSRIKPP